MKRSFSGNYRPQAFADCKKQPLDVIFVGGGISGAGCLRDAAMRGMQVALFEKADFGSGTSSKSSKLIHGGLRYLETFNWGLVFEASKERKTLLEIAPHLVTHMPFLIPVYKKQRRSFLEMSIGVWLYDFLSLFRSIGHPKLRFKHATLEKISTLRSSDLVGSAEYMDASTHDMGLTLANLKDGWAHGGTALNYAEVTGLLKEGDQVCGVRIKDHIGGETHEIKSKWVVNTTGPWSHDICLLADDGAQTRMRPTKGTHLVLPKSKLDLPSSILMLSPQDGRVTFAIPWLDVVLIGTTDTDYDGDLSNVKASNEDVAYLLGTANHYFPSANLSTADVLSTFAGLRPLLSENQENPSRVSREHQIFWETDGLASLAGGKLTTYRKMAEEMIDWLLNKTPSYWEGKSLRSCQTDQLQLPQVGSIEKTTTKARIEQAIENEMAITVSDILDRRFGWVYRKKDHGQSGTEEVAQTLAKKLGLSDNVLKEQLDEFAETVARAQAGLNRT